MQKAMTKIFLGSDDEKGAQLKRNLIKHCISEGSVSIAEFSKEIGLSVPTVTKIVGELIEDGYLRDNGKMGTTGGRRPSTFGLNPKAGYMVGIDVARQLADGLVNPKQAKADAEKTLSRLQTRQSLIKAYVGEINQVDRQNLGGASKELFVKRTMLRMLSCMQLKYLDSADKAHMLESHIRAALNEDGGLWKSVQDVRAALTRQGRKAIDCSDEDLKALVDLQLRSSKQIFDFCFRDVDAKKFLFDGKKDIGEEEQQDFMSAAVMGFTYGDPVVSAAVKDMSLGRELKQKFDAFVSRIDNLWKGLEDPDQAKTMAWSESDRHVFRLLTEKDSDLALAADAQTIAKGLAPLRFWSREAFGGKTDSPDQNPRRVEEDFRPEMPDLSDLADVDKRIRDLYRMGADEDVFKTLQDVEDSSNRIGRARNLLWLFQSSMNTALKNLPNDVQMKRKPREAFFRFWKDLCDPEMLFKGLLGRAENGIDALFANRKVRNEGIFKKISEAMANGLNDATPETLRASLRHVFTDAAAGLLQRTAEGLKRTEASDVIMAFWCMADQALVAILDRMPGLPMDVKSEKEEKDFFRARTDKVAREQQKRDVQAKQEEAARLKKESVLNLGNTPNVGVWPEQGDCQFLKLGAEKLGDTVKIDAHVMMSCSSVPRSMCLTCASTGASSCSSPPVLTCLRTGAHCSGRIRRSCRRTRWNSSRSTGSWRHSGRVCTSSSRRTKAKTRRRTSKRLRRGL